VNLRRGTITDVPQLLDVKHSRRLTDQTSGGFLLGSDAAGYMDQLEQGNVWVLDTGIGRLAGFATTLGATAFRASPLFALKDGVAWSAEVSTALTQPIGYFDQLAVRNGVGSRAAARLGFIALWDLFTHGADYVVSTTVAAPIRNVASVSFIERMGGAAVGQVAETYPEIGNLVSTVWLFEHAQVSHRLREDSATGRFLATSAQLFKG
jgi:hypothetical protein